MSLPSSRGMVCKECQGRYTWERVPRRPPECCGPECQKQWRRRRQRAARQALRRKTP